METSSFNNQPKQKGATVSTLAEGAFLGRLHDMIDFAEKQGLQSIISWTSGGRAFIIHDQDKLMEVLVQLFYGQIKYRSFHRQLNKWSFKRVSDPDGTHKSAFQHPHFIRGQKALCENMTREAFKREPHLPKSHQAANERHKNPRGNTSAKETCQEKAFVPDPTPIPSAHASANTASGPLPPAGQPADTTKWISGGASGKQHFEDVVEFEGRKFHPLDDIQEG